jgi:hypothetical protein
VIADRFKRWFEWRHFPVLCALLAVALASPALGGGLMLDDHYHRLAFTGSAAVPGAPTAANPFVFVTGDPEIAEQQRELGLLPWWSPLDLKLVFFRPLTTLTHRLDYSLWPNAPAAMHAHNFAWLVLLLLATAALYRRVIGTAWVAGLATLLYAIDDTHGIPAGWIANRNALVAASFVVLGVLAHDRWRRDGWRIGAVLGPLALLGALAGSEIGASMVAFLVAHALCLDRESPRSRLIALAPYAVILVSWAAFYAYSGYGARGSGLYVDPLHEPVAFLGAALERAPLLWFGALGGAEIGIYMFVERDTALGILLLSAAGCVLMAVLLAPLVRHRRTARFWAVATLLSVAPALATFPNDRLLVIPGIAALGLVAEYIGWLSGATDGDVPAPRIAASVLGAFLLVTHGVLSPLLYPTQIMLAGNIGSTIQNGATTAPAKLDGKTLVAVNSPDTLICASIPVLRASTGSELPKRLRCLGVTQRALEVHREDEHTLRLRPEGGYLGAPPDFLFRATDLRMKAGEEVRLSDMTIEVREVTSDGRPALVRIRFDAPLDSPDLLWVVWRNDRFVPFDLPAVGGSRLVQPTQTIDLLFSGGG